MRRYFLFRKQKNNIFTYLENPEINNVRGHQEWF